MTRDASLGVPALAYLVAIKAGNPAWIAPERFAELFAHAEGPGLPDLATIIVLGNGFIITAALWASALVALVDGHVRRAAAILLLGSVLTLFGVMHSADPRGALQLP